MWGLKIQKAYKLQRRSEKAWQTLSLISLSIYNATFLAWESQGPDKRQGAPGLRCSGRLRSDPCSQMLNDTNLTQLTGSDSWKHLGAQVVLPFFSITSIRLKWKVQAVVMELGPLVRGTERIGPNKNKTPGPSRSAAQTSCQPLYKGMRFPPNNFPQMDNPSKVSGSFPPALNCSWKQEFPACSPRPRQARVWGCPSFQSSFGGAGPISERGGCRLEQHPQQQHIHPALQGAANSLQITQ